MYHTGSLFWCLGANGPLRIFGFPKFSFRIFLEQKRTDLGTTRYEDLCNTTRSTPARELVWDQFWWNKLVGQFQCFSWYTDLVVLGLWYLDFGSNRGYRLCCVGSGPEYVQSVIADSAIEQSIIMDSGLFVKFILGIRFWHSYGLRPDFSVGTCRHTNAFE